uniref:Uncharacterized protein n=1 Tax=Glossina pallidipes TaxID=7398 RepID=A0A1A9ZXP6_GLOPL
MRQFTPAVSTLDAQGVTCEVTKLMHSYSPITKEKKKKTTSIVNSMENTAIILLALQRRRKPNDVGMICEHLKDNNTFKNWSLIINGSVLVQHLQCESVVLLPLN